MQTLRRRPFGICEDFDAKNEVSIFLFVVVGGKNADLSFSMAKILSDWHGGKLSIPLGYFQ